MGFYMFRCVKKGEKREMNCRLQVNYVKSSRSIVLTVVSLSMSIQYTFACTPKLDPYTSTNETPNAKCARMLFIDWWNRNYLWFTFTESFSFRFINSFQFRSFIHSIRHACVIACVCVCVWYTVYACIYSATCHTMHQIPFAGITLCLYDILSVWLCAFAVLKCPTLYVINFYLHEKANVWSIPMNALPFQMNVCLCITITICLSLKFVVVNSIHRKRCYCCCCWDFFLYFGFDWDNVYWCMS